MSKSEPLLKTGFGPPAVEHTDHLRQVCLFRRHVSALIDAQQPHSPIWHSLCQFRTALDRYQSIYTGDIHHFDLEKERDPEIHGFAND